MKKVTLIQIIVLIILSGIIAFASFNVGKSYVYNQKFNYYNKTEALLDSIYNWDESFMDTIMESDIYYEYELSYVELNGYH